MMTSFFPPRPYNSLADLDAMQRLLQAGGLAQTESFYIHTGDLNWWLFYPPFGANLFESTFLWDDPAQPGSLLGWMMIDPTWPSFEVFVQPGLLGSALAADMLAYAEQQAEAYPSLPAGEPLHKLWVAEGDRFQRLQLERLGFKHTAWDIVFERDLAQPVPAPQVAEGFNLRLCRGLPEVLQRATAQYGAFGSTAPLEQYLRRFERFMRSPAYAQALDLVAVAQDGRVGAFCIAWLDPVTRVGHFEPVGTHPDFQRKGLGKAVLLEALRRLQALGMHKATVCTGEGNSPAVALYPSAGLMPSARLGIFEKP